MDELATNKSAIVQEMSQAHENERSALTTDVKRSVKHLMEYAVTRKYCVHQDSDYVTDLCCCVEACLRHGLRRHSLGLTFDTSSFALLRKISLKCPQAHMLLGHLQNTHGNNNNMFWLPYSFDFVRRMSAPTCPNDLPVCRRFLWIRTALFSSTLCSIVDFLTKNAGEFYETWALINDRGSTLAPLLAGPCALEYSRMRPLDCGVNEPSSDELVQRHRLQSGGGPRPRADRSRAASPKSPRPPLQVRRGSMSADEFFPSSALPSSARDYVSSLHQNHRTTLLYGKNNVTVSPSDVSAPMKGYLSLHQGANGSLTVKWTPNELMHSESVDVSPQALNAQDKGYFWKHALNLVVDDLVYIHYHQRAEDGGCVVFVGTDGVQHPPISFPSGDHPLAFLSCLENGLLPFGQLDPPLWLHKGKGKVFPKMKRKTSDQHKNGHVPGGEGESSSEQQDYVFRISSVSRPIELPCEARPAARAKPPSSRLVAINNLSSKLKDRLLSMSSGSVDSPPPTPRTPANNGVSSRSSVSDAPSKWAVISPSPVSPPLDPVGDHHPTLDRAVSTPSYTNQHAPLTPSRLFVKSACDVMRNQIMSRAFYGWLAHCRHLKTIRTHLACLVQPIPVNTDPPTFLTSEIWSHLQMSRTEETFTELNRIVYLGGMEPELRTQVWPFLLGFVPWNEQIQCKIAPLKIQYETLLNEWMALEAIIKQRDKEMFAAARETQKLVKKEEKLENVSSPSIGSIPDQVLADNDDHDDVHTDPDTSGRNTPEEGEGGVYSKELMEIFALNVHRIEKDVDRCDRNNPYFHEDNLEKLKNIMCTYVWQNLDHGYVQGMCDLAAPLLVIFDDEIMTYGCFSKMMDKMAVNFPLGGGMDERLANMRSLIQVMDPELFELMHKNGDYTHFYFSYRWFLLDFKREFAYADIYYCWEVIWAASRVMTSHFDLFVALALLMMYREIIIDTNMDFTDIIKFFNDMAERHDAKVTLEIARQQLFRLQTLIAANQRN